MSKPLLLMIHGLIGSLNYYGPANRIRHANVLTVDLLGYGHHREAPASELSLRGQADHVSALVASLSADSVWLLGHSMGGAIAQVVAAASDGRVKGLINVEGNFTLKDAFWSRRIAALSHAEWNDRFEAMRKDVSGWLRRSGVAPDAQRVAAAAQILDHQPAATVHAMSNAIMAETKTKKYRDLCRLVAAGGIPVHLIAGARSAADWDVPEAVRSAASSYTEIPNSGHLMMLEQPDAFCQTVDRIVAGSCRDAR